MMRTYSHLLYACASGLALILGPDAKAQNLDTEIVGVWKVVELSRHEIASGKVDKPYGEKPTGFYIYTRGKRFTWTLVAENRKSPAGSAPTDAERVELFKTMSFGTGTYKVEGDTVFTSYDSSFIQSWTGTQRSSAPQIEGNKMIAKSTPFKHPNTGVDAYTIIVSERVE
jgi:hypothetical protein